MPDDKPLPQIFHATAPRAWLLLAGATGVPAGFYTRFAGYLADGGISTITFDYSGTGPGAAESTRTYSDWVFDDIPNMIRLAKLEAGDLPLFYAGHSVGAHVVGVTGDWQGLAGAVRICATSGYYKYTNAPFWVGFRLRVVLPLLTGLYGYLPAKHSGFGTDISSGAAREWVQWCITPGFGHSEFLKSPDGSYRSITLSLPVLDIDIADDPFCTSKTKAGLDRFYRFENREIREESPEPGETIGHMGYFKRENADRWPALLSWLNARA